MMHTTLLASLLTAVSTFSVATAAHALPREAKDQCTFEASHRQHCDLASGTTINYIQINKIDGPDFSINVRQQREPTSYNSYALISNQRPLEITGLPQDILRVKTNDASKVSTNGVLFEYNDISWTPEDEEIAQVKCEIRGWDISDWQCASGQSDNSSIAKQRRFVCSFDCEGRAIDDRLELV